MIKIMCIVGARPNFMKISPIIKALDRRPDQFRTVLVHTGQHYDNAMKDAFFKELGIPEPDVDLEVGSASHAVQTAQIMQRFEPVVLEEKPDLVLVVGDVNSTIACALVAVKLGTPIAHVEAGLRSFDKAMPEEINRILTDQVSELLFTTEKSGNENLLKEGIPPARIKFVGNVMIDTLVSQAHRLVDPHQVVRRYREPRSAVPALDEGYFVLTLHRPSNVDNPAILEGLLDVVCEAGEKLPVVFPVHPRTAHKIQAAGYSSRLSSRRVIELPPVSYIEMISLVKNARAVLTDSGGLQEETTFLGVPCLTMRDSTERPATLTDGTNVMVGTDPDKIRGALDSLMATLPTDKHPVPPLWDGRAAERIVTGLQDYFGTLPGNQ